MKKQQNCCKHKLSDEIINEIVRLESDNKRLKELYTNAASLLESIKSILESIRPLRTRN